MWSLVRRNPLALGLAILLHLLLAGLLLMGDWSEQPRPYGVEVDVVQARIVDAGRLEQEVKRLEQAQARQQAEREQVLRQEQEELERLRDRRAEEQRQLERLAHEREQREAESKRREEAEARRQAELKKQQEAEARRQAELKKQQEAEARRQAELEKQQEAEARRQAEIKRQQETAERKRQEAARKRAEAERRAAQARAAAEAKARRETELQAALAAEAQARELDRYRTLIQQGIERSWIRPPNSQNLSCTLEVKLIPGGDVVSVRVSQSSGNPAFDRSVENAVRRAAPLPVPGGGLFESFRTLTFVFDPNRN